MTAAVECTLCGRKLFYDTRIPINPENEGWIEVPLHEVSVKACMEGRNARGPVCPNCLKTHAVIVEIYDPFS